MSQSDDTDVSIQSPPNDSILVEDLVTVKGVAKGFDPGTKVSVTVFHNGAARGYAGVIGKGTWQIGNVVVGPGKSILEANIQNTFSERVMVIRGSRIQKQQRQKVRFKWGLDVHEEIAGVALDTLDKQPNKVALDAFVQGVKTHMVATVIRSFSGFDIDIRAVEEWGFDVHAIEISSSWGSAFGQTPHPYDCGNTKLRESSEIFLGSIRKSMKEDFDKWKPMLRSDLWQTRMVDLGEVLGRTCAHELGHAVGLVGFELNNPCAWMEGTNNAHNSPDIGMRNPLAKRFNNGWYIMDAGDRTLNTYRLGEPSQIARAATRVPATFNAFNRSYLRIIHPFP